MVTEKEIWQYLEEVPDPEIPVISVLDLGVVRNVEITDNEKINVTITPTYSGCPAMNAISISIRLKLIEKGLKNINVINQLSPSWTTDWMTEEGKQKMKAYGIAPPTKNPSSDELFSDEQNIECPQCGSHNTRLISQFGSTACKAMYQCNSCHEPFDYFKCHH
ncbi:1,2-phenylacetyl-CoA epoxidase subunit PaaD [Empedobacter tilapiae]|uniref:Phenylacetate-CoA oxygenase subunit PaaJ n=1 Tax=Empedobacter tilapiae TaxID=2491114 RepID=A0A4Z1B6H7_9FLAO|nr:1,2-phenylacetyl-CoA epoxidase subunit PaaD [Empedobacter tilapiae]TGN23664.1 phenylacetate-CoA oxygenase subunit PaaJ [Empedobacter tilapiae]